MNSEIHCDPTKRHEFVFLFDVTNGNPNGDPDAGNLPRIDPETMRGLVTDVAIKRKIRDYVSLTKTKNGKPESGYAIFIQSQVALNTLIHGAFKELGVEPPEIQLTDEESEDEALVEWLSAKGAAGVALEEEQLTYGGEDLKQKAIAQALTEGLEKDEAELRPKLMKLAKRLADAAKQTKGITRETRQNAQERLCRNYYDIRMFGAVLSTGLNAGQVRGPAQLTFSRSEDPIAPLDLSITRQARTTTARMATGTTEMGRKPMVPYGLYRAHGFFNPFLAKRTGVKVEDLDVFWEALVHLFDFDHSAARGEMNVRGLLVFTHENEKGNAPAHKLFELVKAESNNGNSAQEKKPPRDFRDYQIPFLDALEAGRPKDVEGVAGVKVTRLA